MDAFALGIDIGGTFTDVVLVRTPGGGGYGDISSRDLELIKRDRFEECISFSPNKERS